MNIAYFVIPVYPVPVLAGVGPAGALAYNPATNTLCVGGGIGAGAGHSLSAGPLLVGKMFNGQSYPSGVDSILSGGSMSAGWNPVLLGVQGTINGSGAAWGPTLDVPGFRLPRHIQSASKSAKDCLLQWPS